MKMIREKGLQVLAEKNRTYLKDKAGWTYRNPFYAPKEKMSGK